MNETGTLTSPMSSSARSFAVLRMRHSNRGRFSACENAMCRWIVKGLIRGTIIEKSATGEISSRDENGTSCRAAVETAIAPPYENPISVIEQMHLFDFRKQQLLSRTVAGLWRLLGLWLVVRALLALVAEEQLVALGELLLEISDLQLECCHARWLMVEHAA